jgi:predicted MPP superfamily phosphohydrolase
MQYKSKPIRRKSVLFSQRASDTFRAGFWRNCPAMSVVQTPSIESALPAARGLPAPARRWLQLGSISHYDWTCAALPIANLAPKLEGLRIVQLSDLHVRPTWFPAYDQVIARLASDPPDLVVVTGDFVEARADHRPARPVLERFLSQVTSRLGVFGILGNHDGDLLASRLGAMRLTLINGRTARLESDAAAVELIGLPGVHRRDLSPQFISGIAPKRPADLRIVLSHYPDAIRKLSALQPDIVMAGHTHGGQVCLPGGFAPLTHDSLPRRLCSGIHRYEGSWLVISRGMGFATWRIRTFCPAEVIDLTLTRA